MRLYVSETAIVSLLVGDITQQTVDAIVNAANSTLYGGGGVDGAIHETGGPKILAECRIIRRTKWPKGLPTGEAVATTAGDLNAKYVIHTVGPIWRNGEDGEHDLLRNAYRNSLLQAESLHLTSIAFPSISTGAYCFPIEQAADIALKTLTKNLVTARHVEDVRVVLFQRSAYQVFAEAATNLARTNAFMVK